MLLDNSPLTWNRNFIPNSASPGAVLYQRPFSPNTEARAGVPRDRFNFDSLV